MQPVLINSVETLEFRKKMISLFFNAFFSFFPIELAESSREFSINKAIPGVKFIEKLLEGVLEEFPLDALSKKDNTREPLMRRLRWFIFSCAGKPVTVEDLAENSGYSICYVRRIIKNELGLTIKQFIDRERLNIAINYLLHSELKSSNIADLMGFCNRQYFFRFFRKHTGKSPQEFLKKWDKSGKINDTFIWGN
jgi:YesN/AraC family two-component response regulator